MHNPLIDLEKCGQSVWLDYISRSLLDSGKFHAMIKDDHLKGVTSNPSIFEKAINQTKDYEQTIKMLCRKNIKDAKTIYEHIAIKDIQDACDLLYPTYEAHNGCDGFASLEVSPHLAFDTQNTIDEARRLWHEVDRANLMIKVPGTDEGAQAIRILISEGINVNVTLLFSVAAYEKSARAYLLGLQDRYQKGLSIDSVHSVASFFISRIDSKIDPHLEKIIQSSGEKNKTTLANNLLGTIAIANAKVAYALFEKIYQESTITDIMKKGAHPQRLLWASTSTKNKNYNDVLYVESLVGNNTVNTMPLETMNAFRDHGNARISITDDIHSAQNNLEHLTTLDIDFATCCEELLQEGVQLFTHAFDTLIDSVQRKIHE